MGQMQDYGYDGITPGTAVAYNQPLTMPGSPETFPLMAVAIPTAAGDAPATDRFGFLLNVGPACTVYPPAKAGGLPFYYFGRWYNSAVSPLDYPSYLNTDRYYANAQTWAAGETKLLTHGLVDGQGNAQLPDLVVISPRQLINAGQNYAITVLSDTQIGIKNYDGVNTLDIDVYCCLEHSIMGNSASGSNQILSGDDVILPTGGGTLTIPHGLVGTPDFISPVPYDAGGTGSPDGMIIMPTPADETNIYLANADATAADLPVKVWAERTHSIQL